MGIFLLLVYLVGIMPSFIFALNWADDKIRGWGVLEMAAGIVLAVFAAATWPLTLPLVLVIDYNTKPRW